eukprot:Unigene1250_Nuclearia_a/m.3972 Unigene1250_Nuclearia_a/g.3972  ORF Unigene1250_Nuclearia_a/g.3972 Unigene1250_Nuclearia_a/m.3972 type:complete len:120 (-) Unigene1250_Nuclearia_a:196-555(-)
MPVFPREDTTSSFYQAAAEPPFSGTSDSPPPPPLCGDDPTYLQKAMEAASNNKWLWMGAAGATVVGLYLYAQGRKDGVNTGYHVGDPSPTTSAAMNKTAEAGRDVAATARNVSSALRKD